MTGTRSKKDESAEASNSLQDVSSDVQDDNVNEESFVSTSTAAESQPSTSISVCSESNLLVPGKLFSDISKLKSSYVVILREIHNLVKNVVDTNADPSDVEVLTMTHEQLDSGVKKMKAPDLKKHLVQILDHTRPVCVPNYLEDTRPKWLPVDNKLSELSDCIKTMTSQHTVEFNNLKTELEKLQSTVGNYETILSTTNTKSDKPPLVEIPTDVAEPEINIPHLEDSVENFISEAESTQLMNELTDLPYSRETGRLTMKFGENYDYRGSRSETAVELPPYLKAVMDKLNENHIDQSTPPLNSCVVNKYVGPTSFIPSHSDDEKTIHPESRIFTVSVGKQTTLHFTNILNNETREHVVQGGSMYSMSRISQACYKHQINKDSSWTGNDVRLSLTFRSVHWRNNNSTIVLGDSNTGGLKFASFGNDSATSDFNGAFGNALPGKRVAAFVVDDIHADACIGYNNIVIHCGLNNVRQADVVSDADVLAIYTNFKSKINQVLHVNKRARVYVNLLLPTKLNECNKKIKHFNHLIINDLCRSYSRVKYIESHKKFCDSNSFLSQSLSREFNTDNQPDYLHLNAAGLKLLSVIIKNAIFNSKRRDGVNQRSGGGGGSGRPGAGSVEQADETYAGVVDRPSRRGWRGGPNHRGRGRGGRGRRP